MAVQPFGPWSLFQFLNLLRMGDKAVVRPLPTRRTTQTQNKRTQTSMPRSGFEPTTAMFERAKQVHTLLALDCDVTVIVSLVTNTVEAS
jgi:hypothetical protein